MVCVILIMNKGAGFGSNLRTALAVALPALTHGQRAADRNGDVLLAAALGATRGASREALRRKFETATPEERDRLLAALYARNASIFDLL